MEEKNQCKDDCIFMTHSMATEREPIATFCNMREIIVVALLVWYWY